MDEELELQMRGYGPDAKMMRDWNSRVAQQWNAYDRGEGVTPLDFGQFEREYDYNQKLAALPMSQRRAFQQDAFQNRLAMAQEGRLQAGQQFNQAVDREKLRMDMEAAKRKGMVDPFEEASKRMRAVEQGLGVNPLEALSFAESSPDWQNTGNVTFPGRWQLNPLSGKPEQLPGKQIPYNQEMHDFLSNLRSQVIPGYYTPRQQQAQSDLTLPMPAYAAMQAARMNPAPQASSAPAPENDPQLLKFRELKAKKDAESRAAQLKTAQHYQRLSEGGFIPNYSYELGGP